MSTSPKPARPAAPERRPPWSSRTPEAASAALSARRSGPRIQPPNVAASAAIPAVAVNEAAATEDHDPRSSSPTPSGRSVKTNGTTNAGRVYFQVRIIVLKGLPPVRAAAANGDSAVGGLTSDRTA